MRFNERVLHPLSIREVLAWASFIKSSSKSSLESCVEMWMHGACMTLVDSLGLGNQLTSISSRSRLEENQGGLSEAQQSILFYLLQQLESGFGLEAESLGALKKAFAEGGFAWVRGASREKGFMSFGSFRISAGASKVARKPFIRLLRNRYYMHRYMLYYLY